MKKRNKLIRKKASKREQKITREIFVYKEKLSWHYRKKEWKKKSNTTTTHHKYVWEKKIPKDFFYNSK